MPEPRVGETAVTTLALIVHELATKSIKYGALSVDDGMVDLTCAADDGSMVMVWKELGGPPTTAPTAPPGFGSKLLSKT